jgi:response regulator of citrate/malate metabolism
MNQILALTCEKRVIKEIDKEIQSDYQTDILTFEHTLELIHYFLTNYAQLVILDIDVLKQEVLEMIQIIRSIHREAKIVLFSSPENMSICSSAVTLGISSYQLKPLSTESICNVITSILKSSEVKH